MWQFITMAIWLALLAAHDHFVAAARPFTVEIVTWGHLSPKSLAAIVYNGPPIDTAIEDMNVRYNGSIYAYHTVLWNRDVVTLDDLVSQIDVMMSEWYYRKRRNVDMNVLIAAGATEQHNVNRLAAAWNLLMLTSVASSAVQTNKALAPTWVSMSPQAILDYAIFLKNLFLHYNWTTVYILVEETVNQGYIQISRDFFTMFSNISSTQVFERTIRAENATSYDNVLNEFRRSSRIMMFFGHAIKLRNLLIAASKANLTSDEYVYVALGQSFPFKPFGNYTWAYGDAEDEVARRAFNNLLLVEMFDATVRCPSDDLRDNWIAKAKQQFNVSIKWDETPFQFVAASYALVDVFFQLLNDTIATIPSFDFSDGKAFSARFFNRSFQSKFIRLAVDESGRLRNIYLVKSMNPLTIQMDVVMYGSREPVFNGTIYWAGKANATPPLSEPVCGYLGYKGSCRPQDNIGKIVGIVASAFFVVCGVGIAVAYRKIRQNIHHDADDSWLIEYRQLYPHAAIYQPTQETVWISSIHLRTPEWICTCPSSPSTNGGGTTLTIPLKTTARLINELRHITADNINRLLGLSIHPVRKNLLFVAPFCVRGSLDDLCEMQNRLTMDIQNALAVGLAQGLHFIHNKTSHGFHGHLTRWTCLTDRHFTLKIGQFGYSSLLEQLCGQNAVERDGNANKLFWTAPELLRNATVKRDKAADIYSAGTILYEIYMLRLPYETAIQANEEVINAIRIGHTPYLRPVLESESPSIQLALVMETLEKCWSEQPNSRPDAAHVLDGINGITGSSSQEVSFVDSLMHRLEKYAEILEDEVRNRTAELQLEQKWCDELLCEMFPRSAVERLRDGGNVISEYFDNATVLFCDVWEFEIQVVQLRSPVRVTGFLNTLYSAFDPVVKRFDAYKVETVGSSYLVVSGLPERNGDKHVAEMVLLSLSLRKAFTTNAEVDGVQFMAGIHTGPCVAGVVGFRNPRYCLFGDTVNTASRMQSHSLPGQIQLSAETADVLRRNTDGNCSFEIHERGKLDIKGKGTLTTFWLQGTKSS